MKEFLENRTQREKKLLLIGAVFFVLMLLYWLLWNPIQTHYHDMQSDIAYQQELLAWMKEKKPIIEQGVHLSSVGEKKDLFLILDENFKKSLNLNTKPEMLRLSDEAVSVKFQEISFDDLIKLLGLLLRRHNIDVKSLELDNLEKDGMVKATVVLVR